MGSIISNLLVKLGLENKDFKKGLKDSGKQTKLFGDNIKKIGGLIAGAFAIGKVTAFFKNAFKLYGIQEKAEESLRAQIEANGKAAQSTLNDYKNFASELQSITTIGDETTLKLLQVAESMGATTQEAKGAAKGAIGLSKAFGISLETAMRGVILAQNGEFEMLNRYIPALRSANTETEKAAVLQKAMADGMKIATSEAQTSTGAIEQLSNTYGDLQEKIGDGISKSSLFKTAVSELKVLLASLGDEVEKTGAENIFESWEKQGLLTTDFINKQIDGIVDQVTELGDTELQILEENKWADIQKRFLGMETSGDKLNKQIEDRLQLVDLLNAKLKEIQVSDAKNAAVAAGPTGIEQTAKGTAIPIIPTIDITSLQLDKDQLEAIELPVKLDVSGTLAESEGFKATQENIQNSLLGTQQQVLMTQNAMSAYGSVMGSVGQIATAMGDSTIATFANVASQVLSSVAQMIPALFSQSVGSAVASGAALPFPANLAAIASGVAGVVSAFSGIGGGSASSGGSVTSINTRQFGGPDTNNTSRRTANTQAQNINVEVTGTIKGKDIALANNQGQKQLKR